MTRRFKFIYMLFILLSLTACQKIIDDTGSYGNGGNSSSSSSSSSTSDDDDSDEDDSDDTSSDDSDESSDDSYTYSPNDDSDDDGSTGDSSQESAATSALIVNGHVAVWCDAVSKGTRYTFISLAAWQNVASSRHTSRADEAPTIAAEYNEGGLTGWRIPTLTEAKRMKDIYDSNYSSQESSVFSDSLLALNQRFVSQGGAELYAWSTYNTANKFYYLCANADSTFSLVKWNYCRIAGENTYYRLRLLKDSVVAK